ncbi:MAG: response regulator transcription factor [Cyanobacteria bacterium P01_H01_bin.15]
MRILLVEDDPLMRMGLEQAFLAINSQENLEHPAFEIVGQAADGYRGVQEALRLEPDIIVMDIGLPHLDGIAATKEIKEKLTDKTRVVMLTSHTEKTEVIAALASGADAYCIKGASLTRLLAAIAAAKDGATYLDPQIARLVLNHLKPPAPQEPIGNLSEREMDVLRLIVEGKSNTEIAADLYLSPNTIKTHVRGIMNKLSVDDRVQAAVKALRTGIV